MKKSRLFVLLFLLLSLIVSAAFGDQWYTFSPDAVPENLGFLVCDYSGTVRITFLGDCTLGGMPGSATSSRGYVKTVRKNGYGWPMHGLLSLTAQDDLTVANLEGVLTDRSLPKVDKTFNFSGPTEMTRVLTEGSIDCVTLANNHAGDYGKEGRSDTKAALDSAGVSWFDTNHAAVWERDGLMIGFLGVSFSLSGSAGTRYRQQIQALKDIGCSAIITVMHAGTEYELIPSASQVALARAAAASGSDLIIGHHPHIVQGYSVIDRIPVVYSLGNCSFGGNSDPSDYRALVVQADLTFEDNQLTNTQLHFYPISVSGNRKLNDYAPVMLRGEEALDVLDTMFRSTGNGFDGFSEENGATVDFPR